MFEAIEKSLCKVSDGVWALPLCLWVPVTGALWVVVFSLIDNNPGASYVRFLL